MDWMGERRGIGIEGCLGGEGTGWSGERIRDCEDSGGS